MERISRVVGPLGTNVHVLADERSHEAIAIDTAIPSAAWIAAVGAATGAEIAVHSLDRDALEHPSPLGAPFEIPPSVPAVELAEGGVIRFGAIRLDVLHTPGHTPGSVCLQSRDDALLFSGDTLFAGGWGRVDLPGGSSGAIVESLGRLS